MNIKALLSQKLNNVLSIFFAGLRKVLKNPYVNLVAGIAMFISSLDGIQGTLLIDIVKLNFRVHHGMLLVGIWKILESTPNIYDSLDWMSNAKRYKD